MGVEVSVGSGVAVGVSVRIGSAGVAVGVSVGSEVGISVSVGLGAAVGVSTGSANTGETGTVVPTKKLLITRKSSKTVATLNKVWLPLIGMAVLAQNL
jgi:hypothetical protein